MRRWPLFLILGVVLLVTPAAAQQTGADAAEYADAPAIVTTAGTPAELCDSYEAPERTAEQFETAKDVLEAGIDYRAIFCTDAGAIYVDLLEDYTPLTVNSFVFLAYNNFYNGTIFHRVIADFMAQGGDPTGTGTGGPGYQFADEPVPFLFFDRPGWLAMANAGPGTNGSQFFITTAPAQHLDYQHTIFGEVLEGQDAVTSILLRDPAEGGDATTLKAVRIVKDPALVESTASAPEPLTSEEIEAALGSDNVIAAASSRFGNFPAQEVEITSGSQPVEDAAAGLPAASREALTELAALYGITTVYHSEMAAVNCNLDVIPFVSIGYTLYETPDAETAAAALEDPALTTLGIANGQTQVAGFAYGSPVYVGETSGCDATATAGRVFYTRGRFIVEAETVLPADSPYTPDLIIGRLSSIIFDRALAEVMRADIR
ncbi:MAG: peptidylprolyl isomerase [Anaerolineae bacterium]|nr:peptidylprolyl isomerase [Anaerolineae bacterium]